MTSELHRNGKQSPNCGAAITTYVAVCQDDSVPSLALSFLFPI